MEPSKAIDREIVQYMNRKHGLLIGEITGKIIRMTLCGNYPDKEILTLEVKGRDMILDNPKVVEINSEEVHEVITAFIDSQNQV